MTGLGMTLFCGRSLAVVMLAVLRGSSGKGTWGGGRCGVVGLWEEDGGGGGR